MCGFHWLVWKKTWQYNETSQTLLCVSASVAGYTRVDTANRGTQSREHALRDFEVAAAIALGADQLAAARVDSSPFDLTS